MIFGNILPPKKFATIVVAAYDTKAPVVADYYCDGINDEVQLQAAINAGAGKKILILDGTYNKDVSAGITVPSNTEIELMAGATINLNKLDESGCIFTNSDQVLGNTGIHIYGDGVLNGKRYLSTAGDQFACNFVHVRKSLVDINIDNFRTLEARLKECDCVVKNRRFENMSPEEEVIESFDADGGADWTWVNPPTSATIETTGQALGTGALKVVINKNVTSQLYLKKWRNNGIVRDLRYMCFSIRAKIETLNAAELQSVTGAVRVEFEQSIGSGRVPVTYNTYHRSYNSNEWVRIFLFPWNITDLSKCMDSIDRVIVKFDTTNTGALAGPFTIWVDDLRMIPVKRLGGVGKAFFSIDDRDIATWGQIQTILNGYGYPGCFNVLTQDADYSGKGTWAQNLPILQNNIKSGSEIASHSDTHEVTSANLWKELIRSRQRISESGLGNCDHLAVPGGASVWTGDLIAKCFEVYRTLRFTQPSICSFGETVPVISTVSIQLTENTLDQIKMKVAWAINNHENVALYFHYLDGVLCDATRLGGVCAYLYDMGIQVTTPSELYKNIRKDPDWRASKKKHILGKPTREFKTGVCAAKSNTAIHAAISLTSAVQEITTGITNPDVYRCLSITGNQASEAGNVIIEGTNWCGDYQKDTIALAGATTVNGTKPFMTVTKITVPVLTTAGDTVSIGTTDILGIPDFLELNTDVIEQARKASAATSYTIETTGTVSAANGTVNVGATGAIVANDSFRLTYRAMGD